MGEMLLIAAAAASIGSAGLQIAAGRQAQAGAKLQRQQYEEEKRASQLTAQQEEAAKRRDLNAALGAQDAIRAARGLDLMSETGAAIRRDSIENAEDDILTIRLNADRAGRRYDLAGQQATAQGRQAMLGSLANAAGTLGMMGRSQRGTG
jgi:hypothetical protein